MKKKKKKKEGVQTAFRQIWLVLLWKIANPLASQISK
jgi:hypothetical protein